MSSDKKLKDFAIANKPLAVSFVETQTVKEGVECDVYTFTDDDSEDLAIVRVTKGFKTPLQRVLSGTKTTEGYLQGEGTLTVHTAKGEEKSYDFKIGDDAREVEVEVGQTMQWHANGDTDLTFYEICDPPYQDGRFENLG